MKKRSWILILFAACVVLLLAPSIGAQWISPLALLRASKGVDGSVYFSLRLPRVFLAALAGAALAMSGVSLQGLFRNVLAEPFTLGVSGGAAVGASFALFLGSSFSLWSFHASTLFALLGALGTTFLIWSLAFRRRASVNAILLCGVVLSFFCASVLMLLQYLGDFAEVFRMTHWMLGTLEVVGFHDVLAVLPFVAAGGALLLIDPEALNLLSLGEEFAQSKGVAVRQVELRVLIAVALMVGVVVSVCGPIGFVGIIVPYSCRGLAGYDQRTLLPLSAIVGAIFLVTCDTISRTLFSPVELPVGVCTALLGAPFFIWIVLRNRGFDAESANAC